jgi:phosphomevalonate kinase
VDGPLGSEHFSHSQIIDVIKNGLPRQFCILMDDTWRNGEMETPGMICKLLNGRNIKYLLKGYQGEKGQHVIICSEDLKFLTSLR